MVQSARLSQWIAGEYDTTSDDFDALTLPLLQQAGIAPGMRVLLYFADPALILRRLVSFPHR